MLKHMGLRTIGKSKKCKRNAGGLLKKICHYNCFKGFNFILSAASRVKLLSWRRTSFIYITDLTFCFLLIYSGTVWTVIKETPINLNLHSLSPSQSCLSFIYLVSRKTWAFKNRWAGLAWCNGTRANYSSWHRHFCWLPPMHCTFFQG